MSDTTYLDEIQKIRDARDLRMKTNPQSWLALIGLFRLGEGDNSFGNSDTNKIFLKEFVKPKCGSIYLDNGKILLTTVMDTNLLINQLPLENRFLKTDQDENPDLIQVGSLSMKILQRGQDFYLRVWDSQSLTVKNFSGLKYYPIKPEYQITAKFLVYNPRREINVQNVIGNDYEGYLLGEAHFTLGGVDCILVAEEDGDELLFSFTDKTREDTTYPGGRYLTVLKRYDDQVILDFNRAVNWPCAYTAFATCPLPPSENRLPVRIEAGEMRYDEH